MLELQDIEGAVGCRVLRAPMVAVAGNEGTPGSGR
jgi:hypothetical protein